MRSFIAVLSLGLLAACDVPPEGTSVQNIADYELAVASIGCEMVSKSDYITVEFQADLSREQTTSISQHMLATEKAQRLADGGVRLITGACA